VAKKGKAKKEKGEGGREMEKEKSGRKWRMIKKGIECKG